MKKKEAELIKEAANRNEQALVELFEAYRPLIEKSKQEAYARDFDDSDWEQEAFIACHDAVHQYDPRKGKFSTFFKNKLHNRVISIIRKRRAEKRIGNETNYSFDEMLETQYDYLLEKTIIECDTVSENDFNNFFKEKLSNTELKGFLTQIGSYTEEEVMEKYSLSIEQLKRARARSYKKLLKFLFEE